MSDHYRTLGVDETASFAEIKKAFRERAKRIHPDLAGGAGGEEAMRRLLAAYETLSNSERRFRYDKRYARKPREGAGRGGFDFRAWLREGAESGDGESRARLIFFELAHFHEDEAVALWRRFGGARFPLRDYVGREDWMDAAYCLAEELERRGFYHEAFRLLVGILREEDAKPYFRHFAYDARLFLKELVVRKLRRAVDRATWEDCLQDMLSLDYPESDRRRWREELARAHAGGEAFSAPGRPWEDAFS